MKLPCNTEVFFSVVLNSFGSIVLFERFRVLDRDTKIFFVLNRSFILILPDYFLKLK